MRAREKSPFFSFSPIAPTPALDCAVIPCASAPNAFIYKSNQNYSYFFAFVFIQRLFSSLSFYFFSFLFKDRKMK